MECTTGISIDKSFGRRTSTDPLGIQAGSYDGRTLDKTRLELFSCTQYSKLALGGFDFALRDLKALIC